LPALANLYEYYPSDVDEASVLNKKLKKISKQIEKESSFLGNVGAKKSDLTIKGD
jgi:hypothetical protein